jgi:hypothetical protein
VGQVRGLLDLPPEHLHLTHPLRLRRRGVKARLVLGQPAGELDHALIRNVARANAWMAAIQAGRSFEEIAADAGTSKRRVQHMIHLPFLTPSLVGEILRGAQPLGLTSDWLKTHGLPPCWGAQQRLFMEATPVHARGRDIRVEDEVGMRPSGGADAFNR